MLKWLGILIGTLRSVFRRRRDLARIRWRRGPPSQAWRTFLANHAKETLALDFFTVPTATCKVLFVLIVLSHDRRRILHCNVTEHQTAVWTGRQLLQACGPDEAPRYLIRDRDAIYGAAFHRQARAIGIEEVPTAPRSPWQNPYAERAIGSIRRECLDHVIVLGEDHLRRILSSYAGYYNRARLKLLEMRREQLHAGEPVTATMADVYATKMYETK